MIWMYYFFFSIAVIGLIVAYVLCMPFYLLSLVWKPAIKGADFVLQKGVWLLLAVQPWLKSSIQLPPPKQLRGRLLVANHRSHLDVFLFLAHIPGIRVLAKDSLFRVPFLGFIMKMSRQIPVVRGDLDSYLQSLATAQNYLRDGETVLIFPEMTRSSEGLKEFRLAPFKMAKEAGVEIIPVVIEGTERAWPQKKLEITSGVPISLRSLDFVESHRFENSEDLCKSVRGRMAEELL